MKCIYQNYKDGHVQLVEVPEPAIQPGGVLVKNVASLVSAGTEKLMVDLAQKSLLGKAKDRPDLVKKVLDKVKTDGLLSTVRTVRSRLDAPSPLGYSSAGTVIGIGEGVTEFQIGDAVACAGAGYASHAEVVFVPKNLCVKMLKGLTFEAAAFTTLGAIAMQGVRLAKPQIGETAGVIGLGLIGLLTVQVLKAAGCRVVGVDPNSVRCRLAEQLGCDAATTDPGKFLDDILRMTCGFGADRVLICAGTPSSGPVEVAGKSSRPLGTVVAVGMVGMEIPRQVYYEKEITFRVSRSYGPGRYDSSYEEKGQDYPYPYVRWTEKRNMASFLDLVAQMKVDVRPLITHRFEIAEALKAYELITGKTDESYLGIVLNYGKAQREEHKAQSEERDTQGETLSFPDAPNAVGQTPCHSPCALHSALRVGMLGGGMYATGVLLPALKKVRGLELVGLCTATGLKAEQVRKKFGFKYATTDENRILEDPEIDAVGILTRHNLHARQVIAALKAGKHVLVEKPLCLTLYELHEIEEVIKIGRSEDQKSACSSSQPLNFSSSPTLMVGYNRRFAPLAQKLKDVFSDVREPLMMHYRVNAGYLPPNHWTQDPEIGGGRIIGEVCHFVDFLIFMTGGLPKSVFARSLPNNGRYCNDNVLITIEFNDGSVGNITYVANGDKALAKERVEVFGGGIAAVLDNFRSLERFQGGRRIKLVNTFSQDKGQVGEWEAFVSQAEKAKNRPDLWKEIRAVTLASIMAAGSIRAGVPLEIDPSGSTRYRGHGQE